MLFQICLKILIRPLVLYIKLAVVSIAPIELHYDNVASVLCPVLSDRQETYTRSIGSPTTLALLLKIEDQFKLTISENMF